MTIPYLLTPGPLTTSMTVKEAMLRDWGSRDVAFIELNRRVRSRLLALANAIEDHVCVPLQGSGTFAIEATLSTMLAKGDKLLVLVNGAYGRRMVAMCHAMGRAVETLEWREDEPVDAPRVRERLTDDPSISHVALVHCETTSGVLNPLADVARVVAERGRSLIVDAMSSFGALPTDAREVTFDALVASSNKCLEGVPGMGFALLRREMLATCEGNASSLSLDLYDQWQGFERNDQWRFTPPTHVVAALARALDEHESEGGVAGRGARYARNHEVLVDGMEAMGFECLVARSNQAPIIVTFLTPASTRFHFSEFYDALAAKGFLIYPGKLTVADSFRVGCIGRLGENEILAALDAIRVTLDEMGVEDGAPSLQALLS